MPEENNNIENQTLDKIEHPRPKPVKRKRSFKPNFDGLIVIFLVLVTVAMIVWWYLEINKI